MLAGTVRAPAESVDACGEGSRVFHQGKAKREFRALGGVEATALGSWFYPERPAAPFPASITGSPLGS